MSLSATLIARNEGHRIGRCLEAIRWADEIIVVVDERSQDDTVEVARRYTDRVFVRPFRGFSDQRQWADDQAVSDWILSIDCDEIVSPGLAAEIREAMRAPEVNAYRIPHLDYMFGRWLRHAGLHPQYHVRLYRRGAARWESPIHERVTYDGRLGTLRRPLLHYSHLRLSDWVDKMGTYTGVEARAMYERGVRMTVPRLLGEPPLYFGYKFVVQQGWRDGMHGLAVSMLYGTYRLVRNLKLWDLQQSSRDPRKPEDVPAPAEFQ